MSGFKMEKVAIQEILKLGNVKPVINHSSTEGADGPPLIPILLFLGEGIRGAE